MSPPGPIVDEAAALVEAALAWVRQATGEASHADGGPPCRSCPVCRAQAALRDSSPDLRDRLTSAVTDASVAAAGLFRVLSDVSRATADARGAADRPGPSSGTPPDGTGGTGGTDDARGPDGARGTDGGPAAPAPPVPSAGQGVGRGRPPRVERIEVT